MQQAFSGKQCENIVKKSKVVDFYKKVTENAINIYACLIRLNIL